MPLHAEALVWVEVWDALISGIVKPFKNSYLREFHGGLRLRQAARCRTIQGAPD